MFVKFILFFGMFIFLLLIFMYALKSEIHEKLRNCKANLTLNSCDIIQTRQHINH